MGATFRVYMPRLEGAIAAEDRREPAQAPGGDETILLVEDEKAVRSLQRRVLSESGYALLEAGQAEEALRLAMGHPGVIHLLVTDIVMPHMSGVQLAERLKTIRPGIRVLFLSGHTNDAMLKHGVLEAEVSFLQKPFTPPALRRKIREVLDA